MNNAGHQCDRRGSKLASSVTNGSRPRHRKRVACSARQQLAVKRQGVAASKPKCRAKEKPTSTKSSQKVSPRVQLPIKPTSGGKEDPAEKVPLDGVLSRAFEPGEGPHGARAVSFVTADQPGLKHRSARRAAWAVDATARRAQHVVTSAERDSEIVSEARAVAENAVAQASDLAMARAAMYDPDRAKDLCKSLLARINVESHEELDLPDVCHAIALACGDLRLAQPSRTDVYLAWTVLAGSGQLGLPTFDKFVRFVVGILRLKLEGKHCAANTAKDGMASQSLQLKTANTLECTCITVHVHTLAGQAAVLSINDATSTGKLSEAIQEALGVPLKEQRLISKGYMLKPHMGLLEQGIVEGSSITVARVVPTPEQVRVECNDKNVALHSIRGSCGTFVKTGLTKSGRPVYIRDLGLSEWNKMMQYWGGGDRFLLYEEHPTMGGRWTITDTETWGNYGDHAYAFLVSDAAHPGDFPEKVWSVFHDSSKRDRRTWKPSAQLRVMADDN